MLEETAVDDSRDGAKPSAQSARQSNSDARSCVGASRISRGTHNTLALILIASLRHFP